MRTIRATLGALFLFGASACTSTRAPQAPPEAPAIRAVTERLFAAMRDRDTTALRALLHPSALVVAVQDNGVQTRSGAFWLRSFATGTDTLRERLWAPRIEVDGNLGSLWAPYDFYVGPRFSHCGYDNFSLVREGGAWRFTLLAFTRHTSGCETAPAASR